MSKTSVRLCLMALTGAVGSMMIGGAAYAGPSAFGSFTPLAGSAYGVPFNAASPFQLPSGYTQKLITDASKLDIYPGVTDMHDMNTLNETGREAGRYLYTTHEVRGSNDASNGSVSVTDLKTGKTTLLVQRLDWDALDGIRWTPWGTLLVTEETETGNAWEIRLDAKDLTKMASVERRAALGTMSQEGIDVAADGSVAFVIDEFRGGAIYKFVPSKKRDLSSGQLYALAVSDGGSGLDVGEATWVKLDQAGAQVNARAAVAAANAAGAKISTFERPEDVELIGSKLYVAITEAEPQARAAGAAKDDGRVVLIDLKSMKVTDYVRAGLNVPAEREGVTGLANPDNLAESPDHRLWLVEDNAASDIWATSGDQNRDGVADSVKLFASLTDSAAEGTGIYFGNGGLYVNIQHPADANDRTMFISPARGKGH